MDKLTIDELQSSLINHEHRISISNTSLEGAFAAQPSIICGRGRGNIILEAEEETSQEEDTTPVLHMSLVEDKLKTQLNQVVRGLINKKFNSIIVINLVVMHMNARRSSMTKEGKDKTS